jgi:large subunit ribosomal protein L23
MNIAHLIKKPVITEKSLEAVKLNHYTFEVDVRANKHQIKQAIEDHFKVDVIAVSTTINRGVIKRTGRRRLPRIQSDIKKAIVEIKPGQKIKVFES